jgi:hypothetical protein
MSKPEYADIEAAVGVAAGVSVKGGTSVLSDVTSPGTSPVGTRSRDWYACWGGTPIVPAYAPPGYVGLPSGAASTSGRGEWQVSGICVVAVELVIRFLSDGGPC